jgi:AraC-like DNA-binding protein
VGPRCWICSRSAFFAAGPTSNRPFSPRPPPAIPASWELSTVPLAVVADDVGYGSEFAFAHAFKREFGVPAGTFRRTLSFADREHCQIAERPERVE